MNQGLEAKLTEFEATNKELTNLIASAGLAALILDTGMRVRRLTPACTKLLNLSDAAIGRPVADIAVGVADDTLEGDIDLVLKNTAPIEKEVETKHGRQFIRRICPFQIENDSVEGVVVSYSNVHELMLAQKAFDECEELMRLATSAAGIGTFAIDLRTGRARFSPELAAILGYPDLLETGIEDAFARVHREDVARVREQYEAALDPKNDRQFCMEFRFVRPDGEVRWMSWSGLLYLKELPGGRVPLRLVGACVDTTASKEMEQRLRESEARFRALTALSSDWYWEQDALFRFTEFSEEVETLAGSNVASHLGKTRWELPLVGPSAQEWADHRAALERHEPFRDFEYRRRNERGEIIWLSVSGEPIFDDDNRFEGYRGTGRDITERKVSEQRIKLLNRELDHRVQNILARFQAVVRRSAGGVTSTEDLLAALDWRIESMARAHALLSRHHWRGVAIAELATDQLAPFEKEGNLTFAGPMIVLNPDAAQALSMVFHEIATNAVKYGALSYPDGKVTVSWCLHTQSVENEVLVVNWREADGPPVIKPDREGYGLSLIRELIAYEFDGEVKMAFETGGIACELLLPLNRVIAANAEPMGLGALPPSSNLPEHV